MGSKILVPHGLTTPYSPEAGPGARMGRVGGKAECVMSLEDVSAGREPFLHCG